MGTVDESDPSLTQGGRLRGRPASKDLPPIPGLRSPLEPSPLPARPPWAIRLSRPGLPGFKGGPSLGGHRRPRLAEAHPAATGADVAREVARPVARAMNDARREMGAPQGG